jgi:hypothetical protein
MVIYNGPVRTVHYVYEGISPSEEASIRDLQRAEDQVALADALQQLKLQYVRDERDLQAHRREMQLLLYGYSHEQNNSALAAVGRPYWGWGYGGAFAPGFGFAPGYGGYFGLPAFASAGFSDSSANSLAFGMGDEGVLKNELAKTIAGQATPEYAAQAGRNLINAMASAGQFENLRKKGVVPVLGPNDAGRLLFPSAEMPESRFGVKAGDEVTLTVRLGDKTAEVKGKVHSEDRDWLTLDTAAGQEMIRSSEILRVVKPAKK